MSDVDAMSDEEFAEHDRLVSERGRLTNQSRMSNRRTQPNGPENMSGSVRSEPRPAEVWRDQDGRAVALLEPGQSYAEFARSNSEKVSTQERLSLGRAVVGAITGDWRHAQKEMHAMSTHAGETSTLPSATDDGKLFSFFIDLRSRKRYIKLVATAGDGTTGTYLAAWAELSRSDEAPASAEEAGSAERLIV